MRISRSDVPHDRIIDYPSGFLKVPIQNYLAELGVTPKQPQIAIINAINNPKYRFVVAAISRRLGKTYIANIIGQAVTLVPNFHVLIMSPNYGLSGISFELQRALIKRFELEVTKDNSKDRVIELANGSSIRMGSVNQVDSSVGRSYNLIIFDEAALTSTGKDAFNVSLMPTLDQRDSLGNSLSKCLFISTPRGKKNWFSEFYDRGYDIDAEGLICQYKDWCSIHATYKDNPDVSEEDIQAAIAGMSKQQFAQEFMADFTIFEGQVFNFDHDTCVRDLAELDTSNMEIFAGLDVGYRDPTALCVIAYDWDSGIYYIIDEYYRDEATTDKHAAAINRLVNRHNISEIFIDSAHPQVKQDFAYLYDLSTSNAKKDRNPGISFAQSLVENKRIIVDHRCKRVLACLDQYQWDPNPNLITEKPLHNEFCHMADALRYGVYSFNATEITF